MTLPPEVIKALARHGVSAEAIADAAEAFEAYRARVAETEPIHRERVRAERKRDYDRDYQAIRRSRPSPGAAMSYDNRTTETTSHDARTMSYDSPAPSSPPTPPLTTPPSDVDGGGGERARPGGNKCLVSEEAFQLEAVVLRILGIEPDVRPIGWYGAAMWLQGGLSEGWRPELVRIATQKVSARLARKNLPPPDSFRYLRKPIEREHAEHAADLQQPLPLLRTVGNENETAASRRRAAPDRSAAGYGELSARLRGRTER